MNNATDDLPADQLHRQALLLMSEFAESKASPFISKLVDQFAKVTRTFSCPTYLPQNTGNPAERTDDMVGGCPYTSDSYPWPKTPGSELPMQPIVQLNLAGVGKILGVDLGSDLLQVWGPVAPTVDELSVDIQSFLLRLIPQDARYAPPSEYFPDWRSTGKGNTAFHMQPDHDDPVAKKPRLHWGQPLPMFGSRQHFLQMAWSNYPVEREEMGSDELIDLAQELIDVLDDSPLSNGSNSDYIGGFGGQRGGEFDPSYAENLLFRLNDGNGFIFAIHWSVSKKQGLTFEPAFTLQV